MERGLKIFLLLESEVPLVYILFLLFMVVCTCCSCNVSMNSLNSKRIALLLLSILTGLYYESKPKISHAPIMSSSSKKYHHNKYDNIKYVIKKVYQKLLLLSCKVIKNKLTNNPIIKKIHYSILCLTSF